MKKNILLNKVGLIGVYLLGIAIAVSGTNSRAVDKKDILFYCSFDKTAIPQIARGSNTLVTQGNLVFLPGKKGKAVELGKAGVSLAYKSKKNINPDIGTIACWVKPVNWQAEKTAINDFFYPFFSLVRGQDVMKLSVSQRKAWANLTFALKSAIHEIPYAKRALHYRIGGKWKKGQWAHLAVTWDFKFKGKIALYLNGKLVCEQASAKLLNAPFFKQAADLFTLGANKRTSTQSIMLMDEFYIFNTPLTQKSISQLMMKASVSSNNSKHNIFVLPKSANTPLIDGIINDKEWRESVSVTGMMNVLTKKYEAVNASFKTAYNDAGIFFAFAVPTQHGKPFIATKTKRDSEIWDDDSIEFWLQSPTGSVYQFIVNSSGAVFDRKNRNRAWNCNLKYKSNVSPRSWTGEIFIPWTDISAKVPESGKIWKLNFCFTNIIGANEKKYYTWSWLNKGFSDTASFARVTFVDSGSFIQMPELSISQNGRLSSRVIGFSPKKQAELDIIFAVSEATAKADRSAVEVQYTGKYIEEKDTLKLQASIPAACKFGKTLMDSELELFNLVVRDLKDNKILFQMWMPFELKIDLQLQCKTYPSKERIVVEFFDYNWAHKDLSTLHAKLMFLDGKDKVLQERIIQIKQAVLQQIPISFAGYPAGAYKVKVDIINSKKVIVSTAIVPWIRPENKLKKWRLGQGTVPKPFTPLNTKQNSVSMYGRTYDFANNILPVQIVAKNQKLFEDEMRLIGIIDKKTFSLKTNSFKWIKKSQDQVVYQASGQLSKKLKVNAKGRIDFDGFMWVDLKLTPVAKVKISELYLEIPFKKQAVPYLSYNTGEPGHASKAFFGATPKNLSLNFFPFVWLGDLERGLTWFAESPENWRNKSTDSRIEIFNRENMTILRLKLVDKSTNFTKEISYKFGLMATPVKPLPKRWWLEFFMSSNPQRHRVFRRSELIPTRIFPSSVWVNRDNLSNGLNQLFNPFPKKGISTLNRMRKKDARFKRKRQLPWPQYNTCDYVPQYDFYKDEWMVKPFTYVPSQTKIKLPPTFRVCIKSTFKEALGAYVRRHIEELDFDGIYFDTGAVLFCANNHHGCGYMDENGKRHSSTPIVEVHDFMKDLFQTGKALKPDFYLINLTNGAIAPPLISFDDAVLSGEEWNGKFNGDYTDLFSLDTWKLKFNPEIWGVLNIGLPARGMQAQTEKGKKFASRLLGTNTYLSYILLSGAPSWIAYLNDDRCEEVLDALYRFGALSDKSQFSPFWKNKKGFKLEPKIPFSFYKFGNDYLVVLAGLDEQKKTVTLTGLEADIFTASDFLTGEKFTVKNNQIKVPVPVKNFRLIKISI